MHPAPTMSASVAVAPGAMVRWSRFPPVRSKLDTRADFTSRRSAVLPPRPAGHRLELGGGFPGREELAPIRGRQPEDNAILVHPGEHLAVHEVGREAKH